MLTIFVLPYQDASDGRDRRQESSAKGPNSGEIGEHPQGNIEPRAGSSNPDTQKKDPRDDQEH